LAKAKTKVKYDLKTFHPDASISERQRQIMFYLAYISGRISYVSDEGLKRFLKTFKIAEKDFRKDITELCAMGLVEIFSFDCQISPREYFTYAVYLAAKERDILSKLLSRIRIINPYRWSIACGVADIICGREPSRVALNRILKMGATAWNQKYDTEMFLPVRDIDEFKPYVEAFDSTLASEEVILPVLEKMLLGDSFSHETLSAMEDSIRKNSIGKALPIVRAYRYLYDGTLDPLQKDEKNPYTLLHPRPRPHGEGRHKGRLGPVLEGALPSEGTPDRQGRAHKPPLVFILHGPVPSPPWKGGYPFSPTQKGLEKELQLHEGDPPCGRASSEGQFHDTGGPQAVLGRLLGFHPVQGAWHHTFRKVRPGELERRAT